MAAVQKTGYRTGYSSENPSTVEAHALGNGNIRTYDKYGRDNKTAFFGGSASTYFSHYSASTSFSEANRKINTTEGAIDSATSSVYGAV